MKLLCINASEIKDSNGRHTGAGLKEGEIYTTEGEPFIFKNGGTCYWIKELQSPYLTCRFTPLIEEKTIWEKSEIEIHQLN